jgi:MoxR-like ATPase
MIDVSDITSLPGKLQKNLETVFLGKSEVIQLAMVAVLAEGHVLIEDVPGVGKTLLAKALARSLSCTFHRIQFTPDLLPSDLIGTSVFHQPSGNFVFMPGPLFAQVILADEINRATPRTQSALLEAMSDRQITVDGQTRALGPPFLVLATQNPFEFEGTYPLPESQLDRFLLRLRVGYPARAAEKEVLGLHKQGEPVERLGAVLSTAEILALQERVRQVRFEDRLQNYLLDILEATRVSPHVQLGASIRAGLNLFRAAQALALLQGRDFVIPDDIKKLAAPVLAHRLLLKGPRHPGGQDPAESFLTDVLAKITVPL